ncbi:hypothetical protein GWK47_045343 [Chionoecetes opilio]|uniref:Uncharacterized protein n=1 Tax=Chionoecetes opilio TaxID=41210 RepID=A0A8J4Y787_CHIOP|nr:hypothetical protein GWK47_045343 [Chionoecetes opilio]
MRPLRFAGRVHKGVLTRHHHRRAPGQIKCVARTLYSRQAASAVTLMEPRTIFSEVHGERCVNLRLTSSTSAEEPSPLPATSGGGKRYRPRPRPRQQHNRLQDARPDHPLTCFWFGLVNQVAPFHGGRPCMEPFRGATHRNRGKARYGTRQWRRSHHSAQRHYWALAAEDCASMMCRRLHKSSLTTGRQGIGSLS